MQVPDGVVIRKKPCIVLLTLCKRWRHLLQLATLYVLADLSLLQVPFRACRKPLLLLLLPALPVRMLRCLALQLLPLLRLHCLLRLPSFLLLLLLAKPLRRRWRYVLHSLLRSMHPTLLQPLLKLPARLTLGTGYHALLLLLLLLWHARHGYCRVLLLLLLLDAPCTPG